MTSSYLYAHATTKAHDSLYKELFRHDKREFLKTMHAREKLFGETLNGKLVCTLCASFHPVSCFDEYNRFGPPSARRCAVVNVCPHLPRGLTFGHYEDMMREFNDMNEDSLAHEAPYPFNKTAKDSSGEQYITHKCDYGTSYFWDKEPERASEKRAMYKLGMLISLWVDTAFPNATNMVDLQDVLSAPSAWPFFDTLKTQVCPHLKIDDCLRRITAKGALSRWS
ncbi:MAG: hypothetical protein M4579_005749, partial [Chaenotheca gracillima]